MEKISREELFKLEENDLMFITNPGRMGDEDGLTLVIKKDNNYIFYRIDGLMYGNTEDKDYIYYEEILDKFPKWKETLDNILNKEYNGKYIHIYMGFGNGLCIDKRIYDKYYPYLIKEVEKNRKPEDKGENPPHLYYISWEKALKNMLKEI